MKKLLLVLMLLAFGCAGLQYKVYKLEDAILPNARVNKLLKSENGIHAKRYGVRFTVSDQEVTKTGLYSIVIGDLEELLEFRAESKYHGFEGVLVYPNDDSGDWTVVKYRYHKYRGEPLNDRKLWAKIVQKKDLPNPLNIMPDDLFKLVENMVMYEDGKCKVIYILPETSLENFGKIFGFVVKYGGG